jgi:hypothetical protein
MGVTLRVKLKRQCRSPQADGTLDMHVYRPKRTTCLRCGDAFESYDPRYNRRCAACTKSVQSKDRYHY